MRNVVKFAGVTITIAVASWFIAWWMVPVVGAVWGYARREDATAPLAAGLAAMLATSALLFIAARGAPEGSVMTAVGTAMQVGPGALLALSIAFPALLAASAAGLVRAAFGRDR